MTSDVQTVPVTRAFWALAQNTRPFVLLEGSTRSGKTWAILQYLIQRCMQDNVRVFAGRHDGATCERTIVKDFKEIMLGWGAWDSDAWNATSKTYTFASGATLEFGGTKEPEKLHGRKQEILWLNEVMEITYEAWKQLNQRTTELRILDWNPSLTQHWVFDRLLKRDPTEYTYSHTTYRDNPYLTAIQVAEIEAYEPTPENIRAGTADEWHWQVYGLGKRGRRKGVVYPLWQVTEDWPDRMLCQRHGYGLDFGFSLDPSAMVECALFQNELYVRQVIYEPGLLVTRNESRPSVPSIEGLLEASDVVRDARIHADSAQPGSIKDLQVAGWNVVAARKAADSILHGISVVKKHRLHVHISSLDVQRELENYTWAQRMSDGVYLDHPIDQHNHAMDALRYWALGELDTRRLTAPVDGDPLAPNPFRHRMAAAAAPTMRSVRGRRLP